MALTSDEIGKKLSFQVIPSMILANNFVGVTVVSIGHAAAFPEFNPASMHANVFSAIPGLPESYLDYNYVKVQFSNGSFALVGLPWIVPGSVVIEGSQILVVQIANRTMSDVPLLRRILKSAGYDVIQTSVREA